MIESSELILSDQGHIYHLDVHPSEIATTIITVGDQGRVPEVSKFFDEITSKRQHREFVTHTGRIGNKRISVVSTGIGPDNIDIVINELDALVNIDFDTRTVKDEITNLKIFRLGTSGALQEDIPIDALVLGTMGLGLDNLMHYYKHHENELEQEIKDAFIQHVGLENKNIVPYVVEGCEELWKHFDDQYTKGITVTCPGFYAPQGRQLRLEPAIGNLIDQLPTFKSHGRRITNFEMETSAIYGLSKLLGHQYLSINTIVANRPLKTFTKDGAKSVENMIEKSLEIIENI